MGLKILMRYSSEMWKYLESDNVNFNVMDICKANRKISQDIFYTYIYIPIPNKLRHIYVQKTPLHTYAFT